MKNLEKSLLKKAERKIMERIVFKAIDKAQLNTDDIDMFFKRGLIKSNNNLKFYCSRL